MSTIPNSEFLCSKLDGILQEFSKNFMKWDKVCSDERSFIFNFEIKKIEENTRTKEDIAANLESLSLEMNKVLSEISQWFGFRVEKTSIYTISDKLKTLLQSEEKSSEKKVILQKIISLLAKMKNKISSYYNSIKSNSVLINKMLESHQRSYDFWQDYALQIAGSYDHKGEKNTPKRTSQLSVKA